MIFDLTPRKSGGGGSPHNLPSGYTELEYIEATGTQYINTGYVPNADTEIHATTMRTSATSQGFQAADWGVTPSPKATTAGKYWTWGSASDKITAAFDPDVPFGPFKLRVNISGVYSSVGNNVINFGTVTWATGNLPIYLMCRNNNGTPERFSEVRCYYWAAVENGTKIIELIPAMRESDSTLGMYDTVSGSFLTNAGAGTFLGGELN